MEMYMYFTEAFELRAHLAPSHARQRALEIYCDKFTLPLYYHAKHKQKTVQENAGYSLRAPLTSAACLEKKTALLATYTYTCLGSGQVAKTKRCKDAR